MPDMFIAISLVFIVSALLIGTGLKKQPGLGILGALFIMGLALWLRGDSLIGLGFGFPPNWVQTILLGLVLGALIQLISVALLEPFAEKVTGVPHDHSILSNVRGNWKVFLQWMLIVWVLVALLEESIYRGFLMTEIAKIIGTAPWALGINIIVSALVFGLSHGYQGRSGILSTGMIGILLGGIFAWSGFNLWLVIFTHGFIDTIGIGLIAMDADKAIQNKIWKAP
jgi:uncharacterized protein